MHDTKRACGVTHRPLMGYFQGVSLASDPLLHCCPLTQGFWSKTCMAFRNPLAATKICSAGPLWNAWEPLSRAPPPEGTAGNHQMLRQ